MSRGILIIMGGTLVFLALTIGLTVRGQPTAFSGWKEFSIGPASGRSTTVNPDRVVSDGFSLRGLISVAYDMPSVRIISPDWLGEAAYSITAIVRPDAGEPLESLLQKELSTRLDLKVHVEPRPFDVLVLRAQKGAESQWIRGGRESGTWLNDYNVRAKDVTLGGLATALQSILGRPVIDETHVPGYYVFEFAWGEDRLATVKTALETRFGLLLSPERRQLDALIVDQAELPAALSFLRSTSRATNPLPTGLRRTLSRALGGR
jgi:uncharacterized protein (TIGR03435 family)